jgi:Arc/MetJ-type ribon-helix-helix transcriptional regulator
MGIPLNPELERRITEKVSSGRYKSADELIEKSLDLLDAQHPAGAGAVDAEDTGRTEPIWERVIRLGERIPDEAWADVPTDLSKNWEFYRYGAPKESE